MKITNILCAAIITVVSIQSYADVYVQGYQKNDGTYIQPHYRSDPDGDVNNNWSTKGNQNPYTGQKGTHAPYSY